MHPRRSRARCHEGLHACAAVVRAQREQRERRRPHLRRLLGHPATSTCRRSSRRFSSRIWSQPWRRSTASSASASSIATSRASSDRRRSAVHGQPNHIAVHIRSGDLFDRPDPHPNFVQPPLAFYILALGHFAEARSDVRGHARLRRRRQSGDPRAAGLSRAAVLLLGLERSLSDDFARLLEHRVLVLGRGASGSRSQHSRRISRRSTSPGASPDFSGWYRSGAWTAI